MLNEYNHISEAVLEIDKLNSHTVAVGILEGDFLEMIAMVNNDGTTIHAKGNGYLMIPVKDDGEIVSFIKKKSVTIPARHFLERTVSNFDGPRQEYVERKLDDLIDGTASAMSILNGIGELAVKQMRQEIARFKTPKNAPLTIRNKGKDDPLVDTGKLGDSIAYKII